jgi:predicted amidohydrolase YtcJ
MLAVLVVLDRDPFDGPPQDIYQARVAATSVDGQLCSGPDWRVLASSSGGAFQ